MNKKPVKGSIEQLAKQPATKITPLKNQNMGRRLTDNTTGLTYFPDRRVNFDRRSLEAINHYSPVRRYTIDRRAGTKDRRSA